MKKRLHLGAIMRPVGILSAWWRYPGAFSDANFNLKHLVRFIQTLERALEHPLTEERNLLFPHRRGAGAEELPQIRTPLDLEGSCVRRPPPKLGEHTEQVLREAGVEEELIAAALNKPAIPASARQADERR